MFGQTDRTNLSDWTKGSLFLYMSSRAKNIGSPEEKDIAAQNGQNELFQLDKKVIFFYISSWAKKYRFDRGERKFSSFVHLFQYIPLNRLETSL
jgi:hypothetical protein